MRKQFLNPAIFHYYKKPLMVVEGKGQWLFDEKADATSTVSAACGRERGSLSSSRCRRRESPNEIIQHTTTIYLNPGIALYAQELAAKMPGDLKPSISSTPAPRPTTSHC